MTTTAEERAEEASAFLSESERLALADELSNRKLKFADVVKGQYEMLSEIEMDCIVALLRQPNLTQAITQAQNDKLEEALAKIGVGFWTTKDNPFRHGASEAVWAGMKPDEMIEAIRSLIQKD